MNLRALRLNEPDWAVAIAASAGGIPALSVVLGGLPVDFPAAVLVVQHLDPHRPHSYLAQILARRTALRIEEARDGTALAAGSAYVAPPNRHLILSPQGIALSDEPRVHFSRPSGDVLFVSVAARFGNHAVAVVLSGAGIDGASGTAAVHAAGGIVIAQDQATAEHFGMPGAAIEYGHADYVLPVDRIAERLIMLTAPNGRN